MSDCNPSSPFGRGFIPAGRDIGVTEVEPRATPSALARFTPALRVRFCELIASSGNVRSACILLGISPETAYRARRRDPQFAAAWQGALVLARDVAEAALADRALNGMPEAVWFHGEPVGTRNRHDARLLLAHLARLDARAEAEFATEHANRFEELLALVAGAQPEVPLYKDPDAEDIAIRSALETASPLLPEPRPVHAHFARMRKQEDEADRAWDAWQATCEAAVDAALDRAQNPPGEQ